MPHVTLREITPDNLRAVLALAVAPEQRRLVAANAVSLAQALVHPEAWPRAVYAGETPVGFLMLHDEHRLPAPRERGYYFLWRLMIDAKHQGRGHGAAAVRCLVAHVRGRPEAGRLLTSCLPGEGSPRPFYEKLGFVATGKVEDGEIELALALGAHAGAEPADDGPVRIATPADADALATLVRGFRDHLNASTPRDAEITAWLPRVLASPHVEFGCAWLDGQAVGYHQLRLLPSVWAGVDAQLEDLFVAAEARGRGLGRALLAHAVRRACERGAGRVVLNTNEHNEASQPLYRAAGFAPESHALYAGGREVVWSLALRRERADAG